MVNSNRSISIFAGTGVAGLTNGSSSVAQFRNPLSLVYTNTGIIYVADTGNNTIRKISILPPTIGGSNTTPVLQRGGQSITLIGTFLAYGDGGMGMPIGSNQSPYYIGGILTQDTWIPLHYP
jgi:hypothetical protein